MALPSREDYVLYRGEKFQVEFYFTGKGEMPAKEYFDATDQRIQVKLLALVKYIANNGRLFDETKFRLVDRKEKIYEFKPKEERFFNFFWEGKRIIITSAYRKKGRKADQGEVTRAVHLKRDYEFRMKGGVYYETQ